MTRITGRRDEALEEATKCRMMATLAASKTTRRHYERLSRHWQQLAESYRLAEQVSGHLEWRAKWLREG